MEKTITRFHHQLQKLLIQVTTKTENFQSNCCYFVNHVEILTILKNSLSRSLICIRVQWGLCSYIKFSLTLTLSIASQACVAFSQQFFSSSHGSFNLLVGFFSLSHKSQVIAYCGRIFLLTFIDFLPKKAEMRCF